MDPNLITVTEHTLLTLDQNLITVTKLGMGWLIVKTFKDILQPFQEGIIIYEMSEDVILRLCDTIIVTGVLFTSTSRSLSWPAGIFCMWAHFCQNTIRRELWWVEWGMSAASNVTSSRLCQASAGNEFPVCRISGGLLKKRNYILWKLHIVHYKIYS